MRALMGMALFGSFVLVICACLILESVAEVFGP